MKSALVFMGSSYVCQLIHLFSVQLVLVRQSLDSVTSSHTFNYSSVILVFFCVYQVQQADWKNTFGCDIV